MFAVKRDNLAIMQSVAREKIGRNDRCPCGSGKKYKHCCIATQTDTVETPWRRQRDASDRITADLFRLASREFRDETFETWADFNQDDLPGSIDEYPSEQAIFSPYAIFDWDPEAPVRRRDGKPRAGLILRTYMARAAGRLSDLELLVLEQAISRPVSFYEVVRCVPGQSAVLRDILIGEETEVEEHSATQTMRHGSLVYGQIWILPEVATLGRLAPCIIPPERKASIVGLRMKLRRKIAKQNRDLSISDLLRFREEIRTVYLNIRDAMRTPPKLCNTDGDPIVFHTIKFRIGSAQVAFDALSQLACFISKKDLLDGAEFNGDGSLRSVEIPWSKKGNKIHETWDNTILGHLKISGQSLTVEVNSTNRANKILAEIEKRLGMHAVHETTQTTTPEEMLQESKKSKRARPPVKDTEADDVALDPELTKLVEAQLQEYVEGWVRQKIPALGGRTPLQAVADPDGKEMVESLLVGWERHWDEPGSQGFARPDINAARKLLNLPIKPGRHVN
jgi:SEC-C motif/Protein of unknown function (DUF2384)